MKHIVFILAVLVALYLLYEVGLFLYKVHVSTGLVKSAHALQSKGNGPTMLVVGDSTAVGVGASSASTSIAGLFLRDYPNLSIDNKAVSGAVLSEVLTQLQSAKGNYDFILIQAGANDIIHPGSLENSKAEALSVMTLARKKSTHVIMLSCGNAGLAPLFPYPVSLLITSRTRELRTTLINDAKKTGVAYVDLFQEKKDDEFSKNISTYYAADGLHPADAGYAFWYKKIREEASAAFPNLVL